MGTDFLCKNPIFDMFRAGNDVIANQSNHLALKSEMSSPVKIPDFESSAVKKTPKFESSPVKNCWGAMTPVKIWA